MIGILGGMGTQAGLDFCDKLAILNRGKIDQEYPLFLLYNKANIPGRPESIGVQTGNLSNRLVNKKSKKKYLSVLKSLLKRVISMHTWMVVIVVIVSLHSLIISSSALRVIIVFSHSMMKMVKWLRKNTMSS